MKKTLFILLGIILSACIPLLGLFLTKITNSGAPLFMSLLAVPLAGIFLLTTSPKYKKIGVGMLIALLPLGFIVFTLFMASQLH